MGTRDIKVYVCDWCGAEVPVEVIHHPAPLSLGADTEPWDEAPMPKGWRQHPLANALLCLYCCTALDRAIETAIDTTKKRLAK